MNKVMIFENIYIDSTYLEFIKIRKFKILLYIKNLLIYIRKIKQIAHKSDI